MALKIQGVTVINDNKNAVLNDLTVDGAAILPIDASSYQLTANQLSLLNQLKPVAFTGSINDLAESTTGLGTPGQVLTVSQSGTGVTWGAPPATGDQSLNTTDSVTFTNLTLTSPNIRLGANAGAISQGTNSVAIGNVAGYDTQGANAVAVGDGAGNDTQGYLSVAVGYNAGKETQGEGSVSVGREAGWVNQGVNSVAIGPAAGEQYQGNAAVAVGLGAGFLYQGANAVAIGNSAGFSNQTANSIIINASGSNLNSTKAGFFVSPVRADATTSATTFGVFYNAGTKELTTSTMSSGATLTDDVSTNTTQYLAAARTTSGSWTTAYVASTKLYFNPSTGRLSSTEFFTLSDVNQKNNIETIVNAVDTINQLNGVGFDWKESGVKSYGVIAQELEKVLPELVNTENDAKTVNYSGIIAFLINGIKELDQRLNQLESK